MAASSFMTEMFEAAGLKPWQKYIQYVRRAYDQGAQGIKELLDEHAKLSGKERSSTTPEELCARSGVPEKILFGTIAGQLWELGYQQADMMLAMKHPEIVARAIKESLKPSGYKDRENLLKANGIIPIPKNNSIHFHKHVSGGAAARGDSAEAPPAVLPSFEDDLSQLDEDDLPQLPSGS
jgi:hypothetical protein